MPKSIGLRSLLVLSALFGLAAWLVYARFEPSEPAARVALADDGSLTISADALPAFLEVASEAERQALADGALTPSEYSAVVLKSVACLEETGFEIVHPTDRTQGLHVAVTRLGATAAGPQTNAEGQISYVATGRTGASPQENARLVAQCKQGSALVERLWAEHRGQSATESEDIRRRLATCLKAAGFEIETNPSDEELQTVALVLDPDSGVRKPRPEYVACEVEVARSR